MDNSQHFSVSQTDHGHTGSPPGRTANPAGRHRFRKPTWNRRKEILIGTQDQVSPSEATSRRTFKITLALGQRSALYFWMLNGIKQTDRLNFYIDHAASQLGINEKTIDRQLKSLDAEGWVERLPGSHAGRKTYSTYVLNPINELIQDDGHGPKIVHTKALRRRDIDVPTGGDTNVPTKRAIKRKQEATSSLPASSPHPLRAAEQAGAGRVGASPAPATAGFATRGDEHKTEMKDEHQERVRSWLRENESLILSFGFKPRTTRDLTKDILNYTEGDDKKWDAFCEECWPVLQEKCRGSEFLRERNRNLGFGWLFREDKEEPGKLVLQRFLYSRDYSDVYVPDEIYQPGTILRVRDKKYPVRVIGFVPGSLVRYRVVASHLIDPQEICDNEYVACLGELSELADVPPSAEAAGAVVGATAGLSEALAVVQPAPSPEEAEKARKEAEEDAELSAAIDAILREE